MSAPNFDACFSHVLGSEGGYQADPNDKGNWTGCKVGVGVNKGTNWGVSACAYPKLDIRNLTKEDAKRIYRRDYWDRAQADYLPDGLDLCTFDGAVNSGVSRGVKWLQQALGVAVDGMVGAETLAAANTCGFHTVIDIMCDIRLAYLKALPTWDRYGKGWSTRIRNVRDDAHAMQDYRPGPAIPVEEVVEEVVVEEESPGLEIVVTLRLKVPAEGDVEVASVEVT